ncbi:DUF2185 domain-containing protein [Bacteroides hominis]|uniref:DUF2185 domain-containing protein n=1 Tax=Bacteroides hominis TaxID=2763023 RepID=UPI003D6B51B2
MAYYLTAVSHKTLAAKKEIIKMRKEKAFFINGRENEVLLNDWETSDGCIATDRITVDGLPVGYMYREKPEEGDPFEGYDSGWRFTAGDESDEYMQTAQNSGIYKLNTICQYDPDIIPLLHAPYGTAYIRNENGEFQKEHFEPLEE